MVKRTKVILISILALCCIALFFTITLYCFNNYGENATLSINPKFRIHNYKRACFLPTTCTMFDIFIQVPFKSKMEMAYILKDKYLPKNGDLVINSSVEWGYGLPPRTGEWKISFFMPRKVVVSVFDGIDGEMMLECVYRREFIFSGAETWKIGRLIGDTISTALSSQ